MECNITNVDDNTGRNLDCCDGTCSDSSHKTSASCKADGDVWTVDDSCVRICGVIPGAG